MIAGHVSSREESTVKLSPVEFSRYNSGMDEENPRYKWPWIAAGMVVLGIVLAIVWMFFAVKKVEQERNSNPPVQNQLQ